mgnify:FL=1
MKNTRKAAAIWLAMSLAISTAFGNTAWGEIRPDTGNNRCVHVHTAECYKDADETATPSQIGKEPTECTHICSVESGCIRDTEKENNENADTLDTVASNTGKNDSKKEQAGEKAADRKDSSGNADENKNLNDVPTQNGAALSVGTPSNAKDTTTTGGTITPVSQTKILSWSWFDPEENLLDGRLELTGITEEAQPSFTEIIEYLPTAIIAQVEEGEEKNLPITNWSCPEYVQDEEGRWPLEGTYEFKAELPEGYELAEGVDALGVEVSVAGDQAAMTAKELPVLRVSPASGQESKTLNFDGVSFSSLNGVFDSIMNQTNIQVKYLGTGTDGQYQFRLTLNDTSASNIIIPNGDWEIVLNGNNQLDGKGTSCGGIGLYITGWGTRATIVAGTGDAYLNVSNYPTTGKNLDGSSGIQVEARLTIESGTIITNANRAENNNLSSGAIYVTSNGTLNINGGEVIATGNGKYGLCARGTINMSRGKFDIIGNGIIAVDHEPNSNFTLAGGTINIKSPTGHTGLSTKGNLTITGGKMDVNILEIVNNTIMTVEGGILETGGIKIGDNGKLINKGELIANGNFEGNGTIENTGTISGSGNVPEGNRTDPGEITFTQPAEVPYDGSILNVENLAKIKKPKNAGALTYEILSKSTGKGTIDTNGLLTVEKIGTFVIQVTTEGTGVYKPAKSVEITLKVTPGTFPTGWDLKVEAAKGVYNGAKGYPAATITTTNIPADAKYEYQLAATPDSKQLSNQWLSECPKIINVTFDQYVFVKVITDNYESKVFRSKDPINIERREFTKDNVAVTVNPQTVVYNGKVRNSEIKVEVFENWSGSSENKVDSADYTILGWTDRDGNPVKELKDAGTYIVRLMGAKRNYWEGVMDTSFTIEKCKLKSQMTGGPVDKVYDGTTDITEEQGVFVELWNDSGVPDLQDIHADQVKYAYRSADVGEHYIDATIITLAGDKVNNYELINETSSLKGVIKPRDFASMTVSAAPLTYNGTEQQPKINASVETGLENVSPDATFTYSKDGVNYQSEIPGFTEAGTYLVYVKASMANFNDETKTVAVTVQKAAAPTVSAMSESCSYKETGERQVALPGFPEDCGTIGSITAQIVSDEGQILDSAAVDGMNLVLRLKGSSKNMVGKTAQVVVKVETKNYEDIQIPVIVTLTADSSDSNSNNNSGNNSGNNGSNNGNSNGSSSSDGGSSDYDDPNESSVKVTPNPSNKVTKDSQKGYRNVEQGVITGASNQTVNDGYSHWMKDAKGWWLRFSDGTWPMADRTGAYHWEKINGKWWAFDETGYAKTGWLRDEDYGGWFYIDPEHGMQTGWVLLDGVWYYFNPISDGKRGIMYAGQRTPDGYYVEKNGVWDGRNKQ